MGTEFQTPSADYANWQAPEQTHPEQAKPNLEGNFEAGQMVGLERHKRDKGGNRTGETYVDYGWQIGRKKEDGTRILFKVEQDPVTKKMRTHREEVRPAELNRLHPDISQAPREVTPEKGSTAIN